MNLFTFRVGNDLMGLEARHVYRVLEGVPVMPVCYTPPAYAGLVYYRGELFDVVDVARLVDRSDTPSCADRRLVVVRWTNRKMALSVGDISGLLWIDSEKTSDACCTEDGRYVQVLSPDEIWEMLRSQPYGPVQV